MIFAYIIGLDILKILFIINYVLAFTALINEVLSSDSKLNLSNVLWGIVLLGLPFLGVSFYLIVYLLSKVIKHIKIKRSVSL